MTKGWREGDSKCPIVVLSSRASFLESHLTSAWAALPSLWSSKSYRMNEIKLNDLNTSQRPLILKSHIYFRHGQNLFIFSLVMICFHI